MVLLVSSFFQCVVASPALPGPALSPRASLWGQPGSIRSHFQPVFNAKPLNLCVLLFKPPSLSYIWADSEAKWPCAQRLPVTVRKICAATLNWGRLVLLEAVPKFTVPSGGSESCCCSLVFCPTRGPACPARLKMLRCSLFGLSQAFYGLITNPPSGLFLR